MKVFIVACNCAQTCVIVAENKKQAEIIAEKQHLDDFDFECGTFTAYEINEYFKDEYERQFFGWVVSLDCNYLYDIRSRED